MQQPIVEPDDLTPEEEAAIEHYLIHESPSKWKVGLSPKEIERFVKGDSEQSATV